MINNYVKQGIMPAPTKKKYNRQHIAYLIVICVLKQVYSISDIGKLIALTIQYFELSKAYNRFCANLEVYIKNVFSRKEFPNTEKMPALMQPDKIPGSIFFIFNVPCFHRNIEEITALGIKNNRFIFLAAGWLIPMTNVSQRMRRLPPPTPIPARKPKIVPMVKRTGKLSSINTAPHPTK